MWFYCAWCAKTLLRRLIFHDTQTGDVLHTALWARAAWPMAAFMLVDDVKAIDDERWALSGCVYG